MSVDRACDQVAVDKDLARFLSLIAEDATFGGGTPNELHGKEAIGKGCGNCLTLWRKGADGSWKAFYDTGSEAPARKKP